MNTNMLTKHNLNMNFEMHTGKSSTVFCEYLQKRKKPIDMISYNDKKFRINVYDNFGHAILRYFEGTPQQVEDELKLIGNILHDYEGVNLYREDEHYKVYSIEETAKLVCIISNDTFVAMCEDDGEYEIDEFIAEYEEYFSMCEKSA